MDGVSLESALRQYELALISLEPSEGTLPQPELALAVLLARDAVQAIWTQTVILPPALLLRLEVSDRQLKARAHQLAAVDVLPQWRALIHPPETAWWWYPQPPALFPWLERPHPWLTRFNWLWKFIALFALAVAVAVLFNTLDRVLSGGVEATGLFAVVVQTALTLTGGSVAFTDRGRAFLEHLLTKSRIPGHYWQLASMGVALTLLALVLAIHHYYLPGLAAHLNRRGTDHYTAGRLDSALAHYQQAIALRPNFIDAHYHLGNLYEDLQQPDQAIAEYQRVAQSDWVEHSAPDSDERRLALKALNNLGRLYLLNEQYATAFVPLERGLNLVDADAAARNPDLRDSEYTLLKNLGWVRLKQEYFTDADDYLRQAIAIDADRAAAHCLLAQVLEAQNQPTEAIAPWETCLQFAVRSNPDEAEWIGLAQERLNALERAE